MTELEIEIGCGDEEGGFIRSVIDRHGKMLARLGKRSGPEVLFRLLKVIAGRRRQFERGRFRARALIKDMCWFNRPRKRRTEGNAGPRAETVLNEEKIRMPGSILIP